MTEEEYLIEKQAVPGGIVHSAEQALPAVQAPPRALAGVLGGVSETMCIQWRRTCHRYVRLTSHRSTVPHHGVGTS